MAAPETFDPKRYTPFEVGVPSEKILCTFPAIDTARRQHQDLAGAGERRRGDGPRHADPLARRRRPGEHPALAAPVPLAHRLRPAADRGRAAPRARGSPGSAGRGIRRSRRSSTSASGSRASASRRSSRRSPPPGSSAASTARSTSPTRIDAMAAVRPPKGMTRERFARREKTYRRLVKAEPAGRPGERLPSGVDAARDGQRPSAAQLAGARRLRPVEGAEGELRPLQHRPVRPGLPAGPAADRGRGAVHRGDDRVRPVPELGHARERPRHLRRDEEADRPADRPAHPRPGGTRAARPHAGGPGQRVQPRHDDRGRARQHGGRPVAGQDRRDEGAEALRPAPAFHRLGLGADVRRRHEARACSTARRPPNGRS